MQAGTSVTRARHSKRKIHMPSHLGILQNEKCMSLTGPGTFHAVAARRSCLTTRPRPPQLTPQQEWRVEPCCCLRWQWWPPWQRLLFPLAPPSPPIASSPRLAAIGSGQPSTSAPIPMRAATPTEARTSARKQWVSSSLWNPPQLPRFGRARAAPPGWRSGGAA